MKKIIFRADANPTIGMGHFFRSLALAEMLTREFYCVFAIQMPTEYQRKEILANCKECIELPASNSHFQFFLSLLSGEEIIVLDNYYFSYEYQNRIKALGCKLVCIDDTNERKFAADLIINQAPYITPYSYIALPYTLYAFGIDYILVRACFLNHAKQIKPIVKDNSLFICFGGADSNNLTFKVLKEAVKIKAFAKIVVVIGSNQLIENDFLDLFQFDNRVSIRQNLSANEILESMIASKVLVVPSSVLLLEALCVGNTIVTGLTADNQKNNYSGIEHNSSILKIESFTSTKIRSTLKKALKQKPYTHLQVDGNSQSRLLKLFSQLSIEEKISLRDIKNSDIELTFDWVNNIVVRTNSFNQSPIAFNEHVAWSMKKLSDKNCCYFIAEIDEEPIGSIRFDIIKREAIISYLVAPNQQGKGYGKLILKKGIERLILHCNKLSEIDYIVGYVLDKNIQSKKIFEDFGFIKNSLEDRIKYTKVI